MLFFGYKSTPNNQFRVSVECLINFNRIPMKGEFIIVTYKNCAICIISHGEFIVVTYKKCEIFIISTKYVIKILDIINIIILILKHFTPPGF